MTKHKLIQSLEEICHPRFPASDGGGSRGPWCLSGRCVCWLRGRLSSRGRKKDLIKRLRGFSIFINPNVEHLFNPNSQAWLLATFLFPCVVKLCVLQPQLNSYSWRLRVNVSIRMWKREGLKRHIRGHETRLKLWNEAKNTSGCRIRNICG